MVELPNHNPNRGGSDFPFLWGSQTLNLRAHLLRAGLSRIVLQKREQTIAMAEPICCVPA